jgi:hypothetical protein
MSKRKFILLGVIFILIAALCYGYIIYECTQINDNQLLLDNQNKLMLLLAIACVFATFLGLAESMFILAKIVPKWLRLLFYFQWGVSGFAIVTSVIYILFGGTM